MQIETEIEKLVDIEYIALHHIDHENEIINAVNIDKQSKALSIYIEKLIKDIEDKKSRRSFIFESDTTEVRTAISKMLSGEYEEATEINAKRLLKTELEAQVKISMLNTRIQKGSLFQVIVKLNETSKMIIIGKADHNDFLDESDFSIHKGLPWEKKIYKSFLAITDNVGDIKKVLVSDTGSAITKYWWSSFLELTEVRTDSVNTKKFLEMIDKKILDKIKIEYPADHTILRNSVIGYFRSESDFDLEVMYSRIFESYPPINEALDIENIRSKIKAIPENYNLDSKFKIDKKMIKKRSFLKVELNEGIELLLNGGPSLESISTMEDNEGNKYITIKSEEGYNRFKN